MQEREKEEILYRLDERTKRVDENLDRLDDRVTENSAQIDSLETTSDRNRRDIQYGKAIIGFLSMVVSSVTAKVVGLLHL